MMQSKSRKRLRWLVIGLLVLAGIWLGAPRLAAPILRKRLEKMVSMHLNARLVMDGMTYSFPYGLRARNAALVATDAQGRDIDLIRVDYLDLMLAEIPWGDKPLVIEKIILKAPAAHVVRDADGIAGLKGLVRQEPPADEQGTRPAPTTAAAPPAASGGRKKEKPSDYFRLRYFSMQDGKVIYEDRRPGKDGSPIVWKDLNVELHAEPSTGSLYNWDLTVRNSPTAVGNLRGKVDVDTARVDVERFAVAVKAHPGQVAAQLPPGVQRVLAQFRVEGTFSLAGKAMLPLKELSRSTFEATAQLQASSAQLSEYEGRLDNVQVKFRIASDGTEAAPATQPATTRPGHLRIPGATAQLDLFEVGSGDTTFRVEKGIVTLDPSEGRWHVANLLGRLEIGSNREVLPRPIRALVDKLDLSGKVAITAAAAGPVVPARDRSVADQIEYQVIAYPRDLSLKPPKFGHPLTGGAGVIRATNEVISFENVEIRCGEDEFFIKSARIPMENVTHEVQVREITGTARLSGSEEGYPPPLDTIAHNLKPVGTWNVSGNWSQRRLPEKQKPEFWFDINSDKAGALVTEKRIPLTGLKCEISASPKLVEIRRLTGGCFGGSLQVEGRVVLGSPMEYEGVAWLRDLDVRTLAQTMSKDSAGKSRLSGRGNLNVRFSGKGPGGERTTWDEFRATGRFDVIEGDFGEVPGMRDVATGSRVKPEALTVGQAAGTFTVREQTVRFTQVAVSAPLLGVQGEGTATFDGKLDFRVVAAPLADWKEQMKRTRIPVVSDVAGEVLGAFQKLVNAAQKTLLYEFKITGTTKEPKIATVPTPVLTEGLAKVFDGMIKGKGAGDLVPRDEEKK